ncbi:MAG: MFS transporter, partial [Sinomicrobium sp.]|nr:MFS transporter [Sinomicrobium sp.]
AFFAFLTIFFWAIFEQSPGTLTIFARDYTNRILEGFSANTYKIVNALMALIPLGVITWVLTLLFRQTFKKYKWSNIILGFSFLIVWGITIWKINDEYKESSYTVKYINVNGKSESVKIVSSEKHAVNDQIRINDIQNISLYDPESEANRKNTVADNVLYNEDHNALGEYFEAGVLGFSEVLKPGAFGTKVNYAEVGFTNSMGEAVTKKFKISKDVKSRLQPNESVFIKIEHDVKYDKRQKSTTMATVSAINTAVEIPASWFAILNSLFIITLAPLFSRWWESKYNPSANFKYGIGMFLLALGMACIAFGAGGIAPGAKTASVSMIWLILVYLFHTMGELCISPVGLSYVSKLVPARMIAFMFGVWYLAVAIGMKGAGKFGENIDKIANTNGISYFFWMLTVVSAVVGVIAIVFKPVIKKLMHGVR